MLTEFQRWFARNVLHVLPAVLFFSVASCGATEPAPVDGTFRATVAGATQQSLAGSADYLILPGIFSVEMHDLFSSDTSDHEAWDIQISGSDTAAIHAGSSYVVGLPNPRTYAFIRETRGTTGNPVRIDWMLMTGRLHVDSVDSTLMAGTFALTAKGDSAQGTADETVTISGSFRARCGPVIFPCR